MWRPLSEARLGASLPASLAERYRAVGELGQGSFGRVVRAEDLTLKRPVAIKLLHASLAGKPELLARFGREAKLVAQISSPHVARLYDHGRADDGAYLVFQLIEGPSLSQLLAKQGPLPVTRAGPILVGVLAGLEAVHAAGVVHRDLKPANVLLKQGDVPVLIDFGLGKGTGDATLTRTGQVLGSVRSMPPDQMRGGDPAPHWDLFAAGALLVELLTGAPPWPGEGGATLAAKEKGWSGFPASLRGSLPEGLEALVARLLSPDPTARPTSARAASDALGRILGLSTGALARNQVPPSPLRETLETASVREPGLVRPVRPPPPTLPPEPSTLGLPRFADPDPARWRLPLVVALLGLGAMVAVLVRSPPPGPEPGLQAGASPSDLERLVPLQAAVAALATDPEVEASLALTLATGTVKARETWESARIAIRRLSGRLDLPAAVRSLAQGPVDRELVNLATEYAMVHWLHSRTERRDVEPLENPRESSDPAPILARAMSNRREPALDTIAELDLPERRAIYSAELARGGRTWKTIRTFESFTVDPAHPLPDGRTREARLKILTLGGDAFTDPAVDPRAQLQSELIAGGARKPGREETEKLTPIALEMGLQETPGRDLVLAWQAYGWTGTTIARLELIGTEETTRLPFTFPAAIASPTALSWTPRVGLVLRVLRTVLPAGLRKLRLSAHGIQPMGTGSNYSVSVEEVHQLVDGPYPDDLPEPGATPSATSAP